MGWQDAPAVDSGSQAAWAKAPAVDAAPNPDDIQRAMMLRQMNPAILGGAVGPDIAMGARQVLDKLTQLATHGAAKIGIPGADSAAQTVDQTVNDAKAQYEKNYQPGIQAGAPIARGLGQLAVTAPALPSMAGAGLVRALAGGAASGGIAGALEPAYGDTSNIFADTAKQAGKGAALGAALGGAGSLVGKALAPAVGASQQALVDEGVKLTPGQIAGGIGKSVEDKMTSLPFIGDLIAKRRFEGITDFNRAVYARAVEPLAALDPAAAQIAAKADVGNKGIAAVGDYLSSKYEQALAQSGPAPITDAFKSGLNQLTSMVPSAMRQDFADALNRTVFSQATPAGTLAPSVAKAADSELGRMAASYRGSSVASERELSLALREAQSEVRELFAAANPATAPLIRAADQGWSTLVQMERAGGMAGAKDGIFTPAQLLSAIKRGDTSVRDRAYARGQVRNQDFAQAADAVLPNKVADSGTVGRLIVNSAASGGAASLAHLLDPHTLAGVAAMSLPYLPVIGPKLTSLAMMARPQMARDAGGLMQQLAPYLGLLSGAQNGP